MSKPAIQVENIGKQYQIGLKEEASRTLREVLVDWARSPLARLRSLSGIAGERDSFWALRNLSFDVRPGEVLAVIGRNGAGKSTLLKLLSRITEPTEGRAVIRGRVASLLEVGTGFHNELTGRENIYLNGAILGMSHSDITRKFDDIVGFSSIEKFLDTPIKRYSSGMKVRLAFSVAAHLEPEILIIDEVLAVGDQEFQQRCLGKMRDVASSGRTVLFVSHQLGAVQALCNRGIMLEQGKLVCEGTVEDVLKYYLNTMKNGRGDEVDLSILPRLRSSMPPLMTRGRILNDKGAAVTSIRMQETLSIAVDFNSPEPLRPVLGVVVKDSLGLPLFGLDNRIVPDGTSTASLSRGVIQARFDKLPLMPGNYSIDLWFGNQQHSLDAIENAIEFEVIEAQVTSTGKLPPANCGSLFWQGRWTIQE